MKVKEFLEVNKENELFYLVEADMEINEEDVMYKDEIETDERLDRDIDYIDYEVDVERSCEFIIHIIPAIHLSHRRDEDKLFMRKGERVAIKG